NFHRNHHSVNGGKNLYKALSSESEKHVKTPSLHHSQEGGESHFRVHIRAAAFGDMSRIARHRAIHAALGTDLVSAIHALTLDVAGSDT
ncbi:MAG: BolA/IbaG family iron-sulfur metabolism protein, partial [Paracoccaceae bacterium]